jgi:hypothetical protein
MITFLNLMAVIMDSVVAMLVACLVVLPPFLSQAQVELSQQDQHQIPTPLVE